MYEFASNFQVKIVNIVIEVKLNHVSKIFSNVSYWMEKYQKTRFVDLYSKRSLTQVCYSSNCKNKSSLTTWKKFNAPVDPLHNAVCSWHLTSIRVKVGRVCMQGRNRK